MIPRRLARSALANCGSAAIMAYMAGTPATILILSAVMRARTRSDWKERSRWISAPRRKASRKLDTGAAWNSGAEISMRSSGMPPWIRIVLIVFQNRLP